MLIKQQNTRNTVGEISEDLSGLTEVSQSLHKTVYSYSQVQAIMTCEFFLLGQVYLSASKQLYITSCWIKVSLFHLACINLCKISSWNVTGGEIVYTIYVKQNDMLYNKKSVFMRMDIKRTISVLRLRVRRYPSILSIVLAL